MNEAKNYIINTNIEKQLAPFTFLPEIVKKGRTSIKRGPFGSSLTKSFFVKEGFKIYEQKNVIRNNFEIGEYYISENKFNELADFEVKPNDILISCSGTIGKIVIVPENIERGIMNQALLKLTFDNNKILNEYFVYFFKNYVAQGELENKGAAIQNIASVSELKKIPIPLPPIEQQKNIVHQLNTLFANVDKAVALVQRNLEHINHLLPAALNDVFENAEEKGWKILPVFDVLSLEKKTITPELKKVYNIIGLENIERDTGRLVDFSPLLGKQSISSKVVFEKGAVLYGKLRPYLNKVWVADFDGIATTEILPFRAKTGKANPNYVAYYFRSPDFLNKVNENCSGARMPRLTTKFWKEASIPVPDMRSQERVVTYLNALTNQQQQLQQQYTRKLHQLKSLKASLLDAAFRGELTQQATKAKVIQLLPETLSVVAEDETVYQTSEPLNIPQEKRAFAKQVLAGKIISLFKDDINFTSIKFQKLQYLAENIAQADLNWNYYYQSAGPYDNVFMHTIDTKLERSKWFSRKGIKYSRLNKSTEIENYYKSFFNPVTTKLEKLFTHFHKASEAQSEIVATLYAAWNNLLIQKEQVSDDKIIEEFYNWSERKGQYTQEQLLSALKWMRENDVVPVGFGKEIKKVKK